MKQAKIDGTRNIIFTSSTAVYPDVDAQLTEDDATNWNEKAELLLAAENAIQQSDSNWLICRLAGLFGPQRNPARFVKHMRAINKNAIANMVHLNEVCSALLFLIEKQVSHQIVNISSKHVVSKLDFYTAALTHCDESINLPEIIDGTQTKTINVNKLKAMGYHFLYDSAIDAL
ncbi:hypothetical protein [Catenovulum sediminis]|uniref:hypothetical protein n=1 Tax=Catenovulum sediminis TaxID=1740262 RepID=UPI00163D5356|nr:hypothetical protein [Catenovulum sediminis]